MNKVEIFQGEDRKWRWHLLSGNGNILATSQAYFTKWNASRQARKLAKILGKKVFTRDQ